VSKSPYKDEDVRAALAFLLDNLTKLHNEYGAGGAWCGVPIPLHEISKRLDIAESIVKNGTTETIALMQDINGDFKRSSDLAVEYYTKQMEKLNG
jgi:hypothetical protein